MQNIFFMRNIIPHVHMAKGLSHNCVQKCGSPDGFSLLLIFCVWNNLYFALVKFFYSDG